MSRWVTNNKAGMVALQATAEEDGPIGRIVKYIPSEIIAAYTMLFTAVVTLKDGRIVIPENPVPSDLQTFTIGLMALFLIVTIVYLVRFGPTGSSKKSHLLVSPLAFLAWAYPISSALLGNLFIGLVALGAQALVIALSIIIIPKE